MADDEIPLTISSGSLSQASAPSMSVFDSYNLDAEINDDPLRGLPSLDTAAANIQTRRSRVTSETKIVGGNIMSFEDFGGIDGQLHAAMDAMPGTARGENTGDDNLHAAQQNQANRPPSEQVQPPINVPIAAGGVGVQVANAATGVGDLGQPEANVAQAAGAPGVENEAQQVPRHQRAGRGRWTAYHGQRTVASILYMMANPRSGGRKNKNKNKRGNTGRGRGGNGGNRGNRGGGQDRGRGGGHGTAV